MVELSPLDTADVFRLGYAGGTLNTAWYLRRLLGSEGQIDFWHAVPRRVLAPQRLPGQSGPKHRWLALVRLLFAILKSQPDISLIVPYLGSHCEVRVAWSTDRGPCQTY